MKAQTGLILLIDQITKSGPSIFAMPMQRS